MTNDSRIEILQAHARPILVAGPADPCRQPRGRRDCSFLEQRSPVIVLFHHDDGIQNSPNQNVIVYINRHLSDAGRAETYSHEVNGHALLYFRTGYNHKLASHNFNGQIDMNGILTRMIFKSKEETIKNMR